MISCHTLRYSNVGDILAQEECISSCVISIFENSANYGTDLYVTDWMNASPIEGAVIRLREGWNNRDGEYVTSILGTEYLTDETGHCSIAVSAGRYTAEVWKDGYKVGYYNVVSDKNVTMQYISMQGENGVLCTVNISLERAEEDMQTAQPNVPNSEGDFETLFLYHVTENGQEDSMLLLGWNTSYERDGILYADFRVGEYEENGEWTITIYESLLTSHYAEFIIFDGPNTKPENSVVLENAYITVTMADGTFYEMSFPEGNRGASWSIFQIENETFRVLDIVEEELTLHR